MKKKEEIVLALAKELMMRKGEAQGKVVETIYFGGGTPSVLSNGELEFLINTVYLHYKVSENPEITLEANPDDLSEVRIHELSSSRINRLSIGIQSFFDEDLQMMNRAHNAAEAKNTLEIAATLFDNISVDLIYGIPGMSNEKWRQNIDTVLQSGVPHISSYALTVEPKTALKKLIETGRIANPSDELAQEHFHILAEKLQANGFIHYELSNFGKEGYFSQNNSAYWLGKKYIGIGPSAHSFDRRSRSWNASNNQLYLNAITSDTLPREVEVLTAADRYNEYIMTGLRTIWGVSMTRVNDEFGQNCLDYLNKQAMRYINDGLLVVEEDVLKTTTKGKFLTDGISSDLFMVV